MINIKNNELGFEILLNDDTEKLIHSICNKFREKIKGSILSYEDLFQEAMFGAMKCCQGWKEERNVKFYTYLYSYVRGHINKYVNRHNGCFNYPAKIKMIAYKIMMDDLQNKDVKEIVDITGFNVKEVILALEFIQNENVIRLDNSVNEGGEAVLIHDSIGLKDSSIENSEGVSLFEDIRISFSGRQVQIILMKIEGLSNKKIANALNTNDMTVGRELNRIRKKLEEMLVETRSA